MEMVICPICKEECPSIKEHFQDKHPEYVQRVNEIIKILLSFEADIQQDYHRWQQ
jgi:hypothetical protein